MKIMWISDSLFLYSGFGTQSYAILKHLKKSHEVLQLGWHCQMEMDFEGIPIKPLGPMRGKIEDIKKYYKEFNPDIVISLGDVQMVQNLVYGMEDYVFRSKWIHWLPVDGDPYPESFDELLQNIEHLAVLSDYGYEVYKDFISEGLYKIYHGIDGDIFKPLPNREEVRARSGFHNRFVCLMVAQNQWRKNIPMMIEAFGKFAANKDNVDLIIHTKPKSVMGMKGWDLQQLIKMHDLGDKVKISDKDYTPIKMNRLYNCANILVSSTKGEGFGLPHAEAMFAGVPLLLPDYTTSREQILPDDDEIRRCGEFIKIAQFEMQGEVNLKRAIIDTADCAEKLNMFYDDWLHGESKLRIYGKMGRQNAIKKYDITKICRQWDTLIFKIANWQKQTILQDTGIPVLLKEIG